MKFIIVLIAVGCAIHHSKALMSKEEKLELIKNKLTECATKEGASSADIEAIIAEQPVNSREGVCIAACMGETSGVMKDNKINLEGVIASTKVMFGDDASKIEMAREMSTACADVTDGDRCEAGLKIFKCIKKFAADHGISRENW